MGGVDLISKVDLGGVIGQSGLGTKAVLVATWISLGIELGRLALKLVGWNWAWEAGIGFGRLELGKCRGSLGLPKWVSRCSGGLILLRTTWYHHQSRRLVFVTHPI